MAYAKVTDVVISGQIAARLKEFVAGLGDNPPYHLRLAAVLGVLPLFVDWEECRAIRPDGEIVSFRHDDSFAPGSEIPDLRVEDDPRWRNIALFQGSKQYPELAVLIPERPPESVICPHCGGMGEFLGSKFENVVCYCGGVGWLPEGYEEESPGSHAT